MAASKTSGQFLNSESYLLDFESASSRRLARVDEYGALVVSTGVSGGRTDMYDVTSTNPRRTVPLPGWEGNIMAEHLGLPDDRVRESIKRRLKCR